MELSEVFVGLLACLTFLLTMWVRHKFRYWSRFKVPHAKASILSGNLWDFITMRTNFGYNLKAIYDDEEFQNEAAVGVYGVYTPGLLIRHPELIKTVFIKDFEKFGNRSLQCDPHSDPLGHKLLIMAPYGQWKKLRPQLSPTFTSGKLRQMYPLLQTVGQGLEDYLQKKGDKFVLECKHFAAQFTTDSIATTILGIQSNALEKSNDPIFLEALRISNFSYRRALSFFFLLFMPHLSGLVGAKPFFKQTYAFFKVFVRQVVKDRETSGLKRNDLVDLLVSLKKEAAAAGEDESLTMENLVGHSLMLVAAGNETSSTVIACALYELALHPNIQERLRHEILETVLEGEGQISYDRLNEMEYLRMVVDEILRKYPVLPLLDRRYMAADKKTGYSLKPYYDYEIPHGMPVYISTYALHYDQKYWPNPTQFDPERFSAENRKTINPSVYLPFGNGPRNCVGARLGQLQVKVALVHILKNHEIRVCKQTNMNPHFDPKAFTLQIAGGIHLELLRDNMCNKAFK
uniref:Cytochrome P450 n=1 Tax=Stomoxys calcitrans TaxID=35570 RepID=A0A1I8Q6H7_STOCA